MSRQGSALLPAPLLQFLLRSQLCHRRKCATSLQQSRGHCSPWYPQSPGPPLPECSLPGTELRGRDPGASCRGIRQGKLQPSAHQQVTARCPPAGCPCQGRAMVAVAGQAEPGQGRQGPGESHLVHSAAMCGEEAHHSPGQPRVVSKAGQLIHA